MYYQNTLNEIESYLRVQGYEPLEDKNGHHTPAHILWMVEQVKVLSGWSPAAAAKAGRWVGWMLAALEERANNGSSHHPDPWTNARSRDLVREDVTVKLDRPVWCRLW